MISKTDRGFAISRFRDRNGSRVSLQKSSVATEHAIWLGPDDPEPKILASNTPEGGTGWVDYEIPDNVLLNTRAHLSQRHVRRMLPRLIMFALFGEIHAPFENLKTKMAMSK